jgi:hypothetical protein
MNPCAVKGMIDIADTACPRGFVGAHADERGRAIDAAMSQLRFKSNGHVCLLGEE